MATTPTSSNVKVTLRATPVGARVIQRLELPNLDKSAELRRLVELGFAAELAGFTLDGTVLRFGGRVWDMRTEIAQVGSSARQPEVLPQSTTAAADTNTVVASESVSQTRAPVPATNELGSSDANSTVQSEVKGNAELRANLRGLAGRS